MWRPLKAGFVVNEGQVSGPARLIACAEGTRASYEWQYSEDGETWPPLASTMQALENVSALVPGTVYVFRYRPLTEAGTGDRSQVVSLRVL